MLDRVGMGIEEVGYGYALGQMVENGHRHLLEATICANCSSEWVRTLRCKGPVAR